MGKSLDGESLNSSSNADLQNAICSQNVPAIVGVNSVDNQVGNAAPTHYVLVTGWDGTNCAIVDPGTWQNTTLAAYGNKFQGIQYVTDPTGDRSALHVSVSDAELL